MAATLSGLPTWFVCQDSEVLRPRDQQKQMTPGVISACCTVLVYVGLEVRKLRCLDKLEGGACVFQENRGYVPDRVQLKLQSAAASTGSPRGADSLRGVVGWINVSRQAHGDGDKNKSQGNIRTK